MAQVTVEVMKGHDAQIGQLGTNGTAPQASATAAAALAAPSAGYVQAEATATKVLVNQIRAALIANGIMV